MIGYLKDRFKKVSLIGLFVTFVSAVASLGYIYENFLDSTYTNAFIWALSVTFGFFSFAALMNYCFYAQSIMQDEIDRKSKVNEKLEALILHKRKSSKK